MTHIRTGCCSSGHPGLSSWNSGSTAGHLFPWILSAFWEPCCAQAFLLLCVWKTPRLAAGGFLPLRVHLKLPDHMATWGWHRFCNKIVCNLTGMCRPLDAFIFHARVSLNSRVVLVMFGVELSFGLCSFKASAASARYGSREASPLISHSLANNNRARERLLNCSAQCVST